MKRSKIAQMPAEVRAWLDKTLVVNNFSGYQLVTKECNARLKALGFEMTIGKSAAHRYGSNLERQLAAIRASTHAAQMIHDAAPDDEDKRSAASLSMLQTGFFDTLVLLQQADAEDDPAEKLKLYSRAGKAFAEISRASIHQKRHAEHVREKTQAAAASVERLAKKGGLTKGAAETIRREILGIAA